MDASRMKRISRAVPLRIPTPTMAANALARYITRPLRYQVLLRCPQRSIHSTAARQLSIPSSISVTHDALVQKKKGKTTIDDLFSEDAFADDELIKDSSPVFSAKASSAQEQPSSSLPSEEKVGKRRKRRALPPAVRLERFNNLLSFMEPRIGRNPSAPLPLVRKRSWLTLLDLAANNEQMQKIVDLFPTYRNGKGAFPESFSDDFTR
jgi:hypothetical protein